MKPESMIRRFGSSKLSSLRPLAFSALGIFIFTGNAALHAQDVPARIDETRNALEQWVETERVISKEKRDLALKKEVLGERIELVRQEIESLREKISSAEESIAEADKKREELIAENERLKKSSTALESILAGLEERTLSLVSRLPTPIEERVKPLTQRLPKKDAKTELSSAQRFQNVVGILNEINKFNREVTVTSEVRELSDGSSAEVTAVYLGIGQAFYSGSKGTIAGVGTAGEDGWVWKEKNDDAAEMALAVAIMKNEQIATFVHIPVEFE